MIVMKLQLYIIGNSPVSKRAIRNLENICSMELLQGHCDTEVIDLLEHQDVAEVEKILATPLLIRKDPKPQLRIIGDLTNREKVLSTLEMTSHE